MGSFGDHYGSHYRQVPANLVLVTVRSGSRKSATIRNSRYNTRTAAGSFDMSSFDADSFDVEKPNLSGVRGGRKSIGVVVVR